MNSIIAANCGASVNVGLAISTRLARRIIKPIPKLCWNSIADSSIRLSLRRSTRRRRGRWLTASVRCWFLLAPVAAKTSVLVARAGWLLNRGEAAADQILLLAFGRQAAQEMDERIQGAVGELTRLPRELSIHWRCILFSRGSKKVPAISKLEKRYSRPAKSYC